jgi:hypothetical protein
LFYGQLRTAVRRENRQLKILFVLQAFHNSRPMRKQVMEKASFARAFEALMTT